MDKNLVNKLQRYASTTTAAVSVTLSAGASVVYTDINPDTVFTGMFPTNYYDIDLNNDLVTDIRVTNGSSSSFSTGTASGYNFSFGTIKRLVVAGGVGGNSLMRSGTYFVAALSLGTSVNSAASFVSIAGTNNFATLRYGSFLYNYWSNPATTPYTSSFFVYRGNFQNGVDHYLGIRFLIGSNTHYGWIRLNVDVSVPSVTIKDYAYESCVGVGISAGATTGGGTGGTSNNSISGCDSANFNGQWYYASTMVTDTIIGGAADGCDSIASATISISNSATSSISFTSCDSINHLGSWYYGNTTIYDTIAGGASSGCDSVAATVLTVNSSATATTNLSDCDSINHLGNWYYASVTIYDTITGGASTGCDSIAATMLTVNASPITTLNLTECDSISHLGNWYYANTIVSDTITGGAVNGCDSITIANLTINYSSSSLQTEVINSGDSIFLGGAYQTTAGDYVDVVLNSAGCDSTITTTLSVISGIEDGILNGLKVIPNPVQNKINIISGSESVSSISIIDARGQKMYVEQDVNNGQLEIDVAHFPVGIYFLHIVFTNEEQAKMKIVKQ